MNDDRTTVQYEIRVRGLLSERLLSAFPEMHAHARDGETVLTGALPDQSALHGVLGRIEALSLELIEVRRPTARSTRRAEAPPAPVSEEYLPDTHRPQVPALNSHTGTADDIGTRAQGSAARRG